MKKVAFFACLVFMGVVLSACAHKGAPTAEDVEARGKEFRAIAASKSVAVVREPYIGVKSVPLKDERVDALLQAKVTLRRKGPLTAVAQAISEMTKIPIQVVNESGGTGEGGGGEDPDFPGLSVPASLPSSVPSVSISYEGPLRGLLDTVSVASGYGWDYDKSSGGIVFSRLMVKTFAILGAPGKKVYQDQITNKSRERSSSSIGGSNVNATVSTTDTSSQTSQTNTTDYSFDIWADTETAVKSLLSPEGSVVGNQAAGTITVRDRSENVRQVGRYIAEVNRRLSRQVALTVNVWALEVSDDNEAGIELQALFANDDVSIVAGSLSMLGSPNSAAATILDGKLKDSVGVLKALKQWGNATQVTSGGGLILSNQPVPVQAIKRIAYLAGSSSSQTDYGQTTEITPGEVTTGFSMTIIPNILDRRRILLQYAINLVSLDELTEFSTADLTVQLPKTSTRAFSQRSMLQLGQTLILAGFQDEAQRLANSLGILNLGRNAAYAKTLLIITIQVEAAGGGSED